MVESNAPVVSNTTPLINLAGIGSLELLHALYGEVWIPEAVRDEYLAGHQSGDPLLHDFPWLVIVSSVVVLPSLPPRLGKGESAAISLAVSSNARAILLDEAYGRQQAAKFNLPVVGTLGVLVAAKQSGLLPTIGPLIDKMVEQGRYISRSLREQVLQAAGEYDP